MLFFYLRHGDPIYDPDSLTPLGQRQAEALAKRLALYGLDEIYASSSTRAQQTAAPTAALLNKEIIPQPWCVEQLAWADLALPDESGNYRWAFQQERFRRLFNTPEIMALGQNWAQHPALQNTSLGSGIARIQRETALFFKTLGYTYDAAENCYRCDMQNDTRRIALFAHQGFGLAFLSCILGIPYPQFCSHFDMCHTGMTVLDFTAAEDGVVIPRMLELSGDAHLYREGLPTHYNGTCRF